MSHPERSANPRLMVVDSVVSTLDHAVGAATDGTDSDPVIETVVDTVIDSVVTSSLTTDSAATAGTDSPGDPLAGVSWIS